MSEFTVAERFFQRALAINRAQRNLKEIATNLNNLCLYRGNTEEKLLSSRKPSPSTRIWTPNGLLAKTTTTWGNSITMTSNTPSLGSLA